MNEIIKGKGIEGEDVTGEDPTDEEIIGKLKVVSLIAIVGDLTKRLGISSLGPPLKREESPFPKKSPPPLLERPQTTPLVHTHFFHQRHTSGRGRS